eukprot:TRINITY_DN1665_c0_g1_i5.p1 TRINITY_DN1665_c0_g1~~TRINITY_DN1665_c0_g1_i5.p1  ORF type:complete len:132 (+),score=30.05 TRINITY_DN1665_c0_g1_i5:319-714(+)
MASTTNSNNTKSDKSFHPLVTATHKTDINNDTSSYEDRRMIHMLHCRKEFFKYGFIGGAFTGSIGAALITYLGRSSSASRWLGAPQKTFLISAFFVAGFWVFGEDASVKCVRAKEEEHQAQQAQQKKAAKQ